MHEDGKTVTGGGWGGVYHALLVQDEHRKNFNHSIPQFRMLAQ